MEVRFMDAQFNTTKIVDAYTSCIWNDEYIGYGDFELCVPMDLGSYTGIEIGGYASIRESDRYMYVEGMSITTSVTEGNQLIITGRSLECLLSFRVIKSSTILTGNLQQCIMQILNNCAISAENTKRYLPGLMFKKSTDSAITSLTIDFELKPGDNLYDAIYTICDAYRIGFRVLPLEDGKMEFELYAGKDRSYSQTTNPWVVFSPKYENLNSSEMTIDTSNQKTTVYSEFTYTQQTVDPDGNVSETEATAHIEIGENADGFDRREIYTSVNVTVDKIDIEQFGKASDRVNIRDYQSWEPVFFDRLAYNEAMEKWSEKAASRKPVIKEETKEWKSYWKEGSSDPDWQDKHPNESPILWKLETIPGDDAATIARKNATYDKILSEEPQEGAFYKYGWVLTDPGGYNTALEAAQKEINDSFRALVNSALSYAIASAKDQCKAKLREYENVSRFSGEIDSNVQSQFGVDYFLGDIVQIVNEYNIQAVTRVVGMMFSEEPSTGLIMRPRFESDNEAVFDI